MKLKTVKYLNEVLIDWGNDSDQLDNGILDAEIIRSQIDNTFIYEVFTDYPNYIKIFEPEIYGGWSLFNNYKNKVYIDNEYVELSDNGMTSKKFSSGRHKVIIKDLDGITDCYAMFHNCIQLISVPYFDISKTEITANMFYNCQSLIRVPKFYIPKVNNMSQMFKKCKKLKSVPLFTMGLDTKNINMEDMFVNCKKLDEKTINSWSSVYDFYKEREIRNPDSGWWHGV